MSGYQFIIQPDELILITGSNGFIGSKVVETLVRYGFSNLRCFVRPSSQVAELNRVLFSSPNTVSQIVHGNLLNREDCLRAVDGATVIFHLAAGIEKSFPGSYLNSVVTTRNLLESAARGAKLKRFLNVSSFAVYSNRHIKRHGLLDENCEVEKHLAQRYEAYTFAKAKQDEMVMEYGTKHKIPYVIVRPGAVYGPGKTQITARVGIDTFGLFLHLGGRNRIPLTYIDNCAEAIVLAGLTPGVEGEIFNIVDDHPPSSHRFLKMYKDHVGHFRSLYIPYPLFSLLCLIWEKYSFWSKGQLPPAFNRFRCAAYWKGNRYSNEKLKTRLGWMPRVPFEEGARRYFDFCKRAGAKHA